VNKGVIDLERLVSLCSSNPARIFSLKDRGTLSANAHADITILDPACEWTFDVAVKVKKSKHAVSRSLDDWRGGSHDRWWPTRLPAPGLHANNGLKEPDRFGK